MAVSLSKDMQRPKVVGDFGGMINFTVIAVGLMLAILLAPHKDAPPRPTEVREVCQAPKELLADLHLPEVTAVNWGQWHGPYSLPPERLVLCADGSIFLWKRGGQMMQLASNQVAELLPSLLKLWPRDRGAQDGDFIWILDQDYNLVIAPIMQRRSGQKLVEIKHGDLAPGKTFFGDNGISGPYRGLARLGGEFNLAGSRNGSEWIMHAKSGYTAYRVPVADAARYYNVQIQAGRSERDIAKNFQRCVYREIYRVREALVRLFCFLRRHGVKASLGEVRQCDIRSSAGGLPDLQGCTVKDAGNASVCSYPSTQEQVPTLHIIDWYAPGQDRCKLSVDDYDSMLKNVELDLGRLSEGDDLKPSTVQKQIRSLRKHSCLFFKEFTDHLHCNVHGCFGEGFSRKLKEVELILQSDVQEAKRLWSLASTAWRHCKGETSNNEAV
eukprot:symbB.v1.2.012294.t1/scaffold848.1/size158107/5